MTDLRIELKGSKGKGRFAIVDAEDFDRLNRYKWYPSPKGYAFRVESEGKNIWLHKCIIPTKTNQWIDHKNGNPLDNRKENLRFATNKENQWNSKLRRDNTSGYKGVSKSGKKWQANIRVSGTAKYMGVFSSKKEAAIAYNKEAKKEFGEFARLNVIGEGNE